MSARTHLRRYELLALMACAVTNLSNSVLHASIHLSGLGSPALHIAPRASIPSLMDICWVRKRKLLLRHYAGMESGAAHTTHRHGICSSERRVGGRATRRQRQRNSPDIDDMKHALRVQMRSAIRSARGDLLLNNSADYYERFPLALYEMRPTKQE